MSRGRSRRRSRLCAECGAQCKARSQDPETVTWAEIKLDAQRTEPLRCPSISIFLKKILFIYLTERGTEREGTQAGGAGEGEAGFLLSREPNGGLIPGLWDHDPSHRQVLNWLSHPDIPLLYCIVLYCIVLYYFNQVFFFFQDFI